MDNILFLFLFYYHFIPKPIDRFDFNICTRIFELFAKILNLCIYEVKIINLVNMISPY